MCCHYSSFKSVPDHTSLLFLSIIIVSIIIMSCPVKDRVDEQRDDGLPGMEGHQTFDQINESNLKASFW